MMIAPTAPLIPNRKEISYDLIDGEVILIHLKTGSYYSLEKTGAWIWSFIAAGTEFGRLRDAVSVEYPDEQNMESILREFISQLFDEGLIVSSPDATNGLAESPSQEQRKSKPPETFEPPQLNVFTDMQALLLLDPIHEVDEAGWPSSQPVDMGETTAPTGKSKKQ